MNPHIRNAGRHAIRRATRPWHLFRAAWRVVRHRKIARRMEDSRLMFFAEVLASDHLNYGYFDDEGVHPEALSVNDIVGAQARYGELILQQVVDVRGEVLDVGCGMGGILQLLYSAGLKATGLTPDRLQLDHLKNHSPHLEIIHSALESLDEAPHRGQFEAVITAESLQYLKLDRAIPKIEALLSPTGRWVVCDSFRTADVSGSGRSGGHDWSKFLQLLQDRGWHVVSNRDITENVLPMLAHIEMLCRRFGLPLIQLVASELARKRPGLHYLVEDSLASLRTACEEAADQVTPDVFRRTRRYALLTLRPPDSLASVTAPVSQRMRK